MIRIKEPLIAALFRTVDFFVVFIKKMRNFFSSIFLLVFKKLSHWGNIIVASKRIPERKEV